MNEEKPPSVILLRRGKGAWYAHLPHLLPHWQCEPGPIYFVVESARKAVEATCRAAGDPQTPDLKVKVDKGTRLQRDDVLQLIAVNGGPDGLDLSETDLRAIDLSSDAIYRALPDWGSEPGTPWQKWYSSHTLGINLQGALLERTDFSGGHVWRGDFRGAVLRGCILRGVDAGHADFEGADLTKADLADAELTRANIREVNLDGVVLRGANCQGLNFLQVRSLRAVYFALCRLNGALITRECVASGIGEERDKDWQRAKEAYLVLKNNFNSIGRYDDASWAYVKEQQMEKMANYREWRSHGWRLWRARASFGRWLWKWTCQLLAGYGESPHMPLIWAAVLSILVFPLLYWATGALPGHDPAFTSAAPSDIDWAGWGDSIIFSLTSFGTLAFNRLQPDGALANILAAFEGFAGVLTFALFVFTLGNRMRRS